MKKKILYIVNDLNFFLSHRLELALEAKKKFEVYICSPINHGNVDILKKLKLKFIPLNIERSSKNLFKDLLLTFSMFRIIKKLNPEILQLITMKPLVYGGLISILLNIKMTIFTFSGLGHIHYGKNIILRNIILFLLKISISKNKRCIIFLQNKSNFKYLKKKNVIKNNKIIFTKGSGVNLNKFKPKKKRFKKITITLVARMSSEKGIYEFVEASKKYYKINKKINFFLVGKYDPYGPNPIPLENLKEFNNKKKFPNLFWLGNKKKIVDIYNKSSIIVLPSYHEGAPKALLEAAACGKPIIASNISGCREIVENNKNGILIPIKSSNAIVKAIKKILSNSKIKDKMEAFSRKKAIREFDVNKVVQKNLNCYLSIN